MVTRKRLKVIKNKEIVSDITVRRRLDEETRERRDLLEEMVRRRTAELEEKMRRRENFLKAQQAVLLKWARSEAIDSGDYLAALREIAEDAARTLEVERVGVWFYNEERSTIKCVDQYQYSSGSHSVGACLTVSDYPTYFEALEAERLIAAYDAQGDDRTREFTGSYLKPLGITSMLDAPIRLDGRIVGIVCHEQVGRKRCWTAEEQNFAGSVADFISLVVRRREQKEAEDNLEKQLRFLQCLLDTIPNPVYYKDRQGKYLSCNSAFEEFHGVSREEILGRTVFDIAPTKWAERYTELDQELVAEGGTQVYEGEAFQFGGGALDAIFYKSAFPSPDGSPEGIVGVIVDINERKRMETALEESERQYRELVDNIPVGILRSTLDGKIIMANSKACSMFGFESKAKMLAVKAADIYAVPAESRAFLKQLLEEVEVEGAQLRLKRKDGTTFWAFIKSRVIKNEKGKTAYIDSVIQDITEQKQLEQEFVRLDRLNLVGEIAASIGHEVRNPLATVRGFLQLLGERSAGDERQGRNREYYELMIGELDRANAIISEFLILAKDRAIDLRPANLNRIIEAILPLIQADAIISDKYVRTELENVPDLLLDEKEVRQLILNLVRNGLEAMGPLGILTITTVLEQREVVLAVKDEGQGIDPGIIERLGTPFVTTKENGIGLGLAVCYSIAARHGAAIEVDTGRKGTAFRVRFKLNS